jgi:predicted RNase H-like HicB family nuclease
MGTDAMRNEYTAVIQHTGQWWIGWVEEVPGVNSQGATREELIENLKDCLDEMLEYYREKSKVGIEGPYEEVSLAG